MVKQSSGERRDGAARTFLNVQGALRGDLLPAVSTDPGRTAAARAFLMTKAALEAHAVIPPEVLPITPEQSEVDMGPDLLSKRAPIQRPEGES